MQEKRYGLSNMENRVSTLLLCPSRNAVIGTVQPMHCGTITHRETLQVVHALFGGKSCFQPCDWSRGCTCWLMGRTCAHMLFLETLGPDGVMRLDVSEGVLD